MDSYFQVRDAERTAWFTSQEVRNIADVAAMVTKALDAAGGEGKPPSKHLRITVEFPCGRSPRIVSARRCGTFL